MEFMINMMGNDGVLDRRTLPENIREYSEPVSETPETKKRPGSVTRLKELERQEIKKALELFGNGTEGKKKAARELGISLATLYRKLEEISQNKN